MLPFNHPVYTKQDLFDTIHAVKGVREMTFRYDLLDKEDRRIGTLDTVENGSISMQSLAQIKRSAKFRITDNGEIDYLTDRIQPVCIIKMPKKRSRTILIEDQAFFVSPYQINITPTRTVTNEQWFQQDVEVPLGVFLLSSPTRGDEGAVVKREVDAYDGLIVLRDDHFISRYFIPAGTNYRDAVIALFSSAGIEKHNIESTDRETSKDMEFEPGTSKLEAANELLRAINFTVVHVDVNGYYTSRRYKSPTDRAAEYTYRDDQSSIILPGMTEEFDLAGVPNQWLVKYSNAEEETLFSSYTNDNPDSITSTVSLGRTITDPMREIENIADQQALDDYVQRIAFEASQVYKKTAFRTGINPFHDYSDVYNLEYSRLGVKDKYSETAWTMNLKAGEPMEHEARRIVQI